VARSIGRPGGLGFADCAEKIERDAAAAPRQMSSILTGKINFS
jgi:hypothetical protein